MNLLNLRFALTFAVLTLAANTNAAPGPLPQPEEDLRKIETPTILYSGNRVDGVRGLRLVDWDGQNDRSYMYDPSMYFITVEFSKDGSRIVALADTRNGYGIFVFDLDSQRAFDVTPVHGAMVFENPSWSRDGKWLVISGTTHVGAGFHSDLYKLNISTGSLINLTNSKERRNRTGSWSVEDKIAFVRAPKEDTINDIYVMDANGKNRVNLTNSPESHELQPSWSPDGKRIAFTSDMGAEFPHYDLFVIDADGSNMERLTRSAEWDYRPSWSPDGKWIAFTAGLYDSGIPWDLYRIHVETKEIVRMTHGKPGGNSATWVLAGKGRWLSVSPSGRLPSFWAPLKEGSVGAGDGLSPPK